jgi:transcriptional regulator with XRE-family HTH domain
MIQEEEVIRQFIAELRNKRRDKALTLRQLEELCGVSASFVARMENEQRSNPGFLVVLKLSNALNIDLSLLLDKCRNRI